MKFASTSTGDTFYESFSDLIFATMAIFVLLMTVFLAMIRPPSPNAEQAVEQQHQLAEALEELQRITDERDRAREQNQELVTDLYSAQSSVTATGLSLVVAVDTTGSMAEPIGHLVEALRTIIVVLPRITPDFHIGIVAYRDTGDGRPLHVFPLTQILIPAKDAGHSLSDIESYLGTLEAANGLAPIGMAVDEAIGMFDMVPSDFGGYESFMLLGDVGPYEQNYDDLEYTPAERKFETPITRRIADWAGGDEKRSVITLFSGNPENAGAGSAMREKLEQSMRFFESIAVAANQPENYTRNPARILEFLLTAIVEQNK